MRRTVAIVGFSLAVLLLVATSTLYHAQRGRLSDPIRLIDPAGFRAFELGVPKERVVALANLLGVDPQEIGRDFPVDYYENLFLSPPYGQRTKPIGRAEAMAAMKGYAAMCDVFAERPGKSTAYFFFAADDTKPMAEVPSVVVLSFDGEVAGEVGAIFIAPLHDPDVRWTEFEGCIAERGALGVMPE